MLHFLYHDLSHNLMIAAANSTETSIISTQPYYVTSGESVLLTRTAVRPQNSYCYHVLSFCQSRCPRGLRRKSRPARLLELRVRIPPAVCMSFVSVVCCQNDHLSRGVLLNPAGGMYVLCECCVLSGWSLVKRSPTDCGVSEYGREASIMRGPWSTRGCCNMREKNCLALELYNKLKSGLVLRSPIISVEI
jgi:hypothetical protein